MFKKEFRPQINALADVLEKRLLPTFDNVEEEAENIAENTWEEFMSMPATGEEDPGSLAEIAEQAGVSHYILLTGVRQGMVNLFAAALYHLFEQQLMLFHRKELLDLTEENESRHFSSKEIVRRLERAGINVEKFRAWSKIEELRLVANTVKHAEGQSAKQLLAIRPDYFRNPIGVESLFATKPDDIRIFQPLVGEDLYVSQPAINEYKNCLLGFWDELSQSLQSA